MRILKRLAGIATAAALTTGLVAGVAAPSNADATRVAPQVYPTVQMFDTGWG